MADGGVLMSVRVMENMDENLDIKRITDALDNLKQRHIGQYLEYITEYCHKEYKWDQSKTETALEHATKAGFVYTAQSNNKISYRKRSQGIIIQDNVNSIETQTEEIAAIHDNGLTNLKNELLELKRFTHNEIISLKTQTSCNNMNQIGVVEMNEKDDTYLKPLLRSLEERVISLEKQLEDKQRIIEALIRWPNQQVNKPNQNKEEPLMGNRRERVDKEKEPTSNETKNMDNKKMKESQKNLLSKGNNAKSNDPRLQKNMQEKSITTTNNEDGQEKREKEKQDKRTKINQRKNVTIIGDSILNGLSEQGLRKKHNVKIRAHSGATSYDIKDHMRPIARRKPDYIIVHCGTNDLTKKDGINTLETIREMIIETKKETPQTTIVLSTLTMRRDHEGMNKKVNNLNRDLKKLAVEINIPIIDNSNIDISCLSSRQLHLNRKGDSVLARNFIRYIDNI